MSLKNAVFKTGATWAPTGGTDVTFVPDGRVVSDGVNLVVTADDNLLLRRSLTARSTLPAAPAKVGDYARLGRNSVVYRIPFVAADGKTYTQTVKIETAFHAEYTSTQKGVAVTDGAALMLDDDFQSFWKSSILD
jgi:hypothetical protein